MRKLFTKNLKSLVKQLFYEGRTQIRDARTQSETTEAELRTKVERKKKSQKLK